MGNQRERPRKEALSVAASVATIVGTVVAIVVAVIQWKGPGPGPAPTRDPAPTVVAQGPSPDAPAASSDGTAAPPDPGTGFDAPGPCEPSLSLSQGSGPSGTALRVTGSGFPADNPVELRFHTEEMLPSLTDAAGTFVADVVVPGSMDPFAPLQVQITATTKRDLCFESTPYRLTD